jgi:hypothetical protein
MKKMITPLVRRGVGLRMNLLAMLLMMSGSVWGLDYYWVGGSGSWSDYANHWATSSGGNVFHDQVPTSMDNVYFDANSFPSGGGVVSIDQTIIYCMNMDWTGATGTPVLTGPSDKTLWIYGSVRLIPQMSWTFSGQVNFRAFQGGKTIVTAGHNLGTVSFDGEGGAWTLGDGFICRSFNLIKGSFDTDSKELRVLQRFEANLSSVAMLNMGSSNVYIGSNEYTWTRFILRSTLPYTTSHSTIYFMSEDSSSQNFDAFNINFNNVIFSARTRLSSVSCKYSKAEFINNADIVNSVQFDTLKFTPGKNYFLSQNSKITIKENGSLLASGTCTAPVTILSSSLQGIKATIEKNGAPVSLNYVVLRDIHTSGTATFNASSSTDLGNNLGWNFTEAASRNLYWVGGAGDWNNPDRWALSSGGTPGNCIPTANDNVFFDENSGFIGQGDAVQINVPAAFCKSMDWTGVSNSPLFYSTNVNGKLYIKGSLRWVPEMSINLYGIIEFISNTQTNTITTANHSINAGVIFNNSTGDWMLQDSLICYGISHTRGKLNTQNRYIKVVSGFNSSGENTRVLMLGSSIIELTNSCSSFNIINNGFYAETDSVTILYSNSETSFYNCTSFNGAGLTYYKILSNSNIGISGDNIFHYAYFGGNARISDNNAFDTLILNGGRNYQLAPGKVLRISPNGELITLSNCSDFVTITSQSQGNPAFIEKSSGSIVLNYAIIQDVHTIGGAIFESTNSADLGNNIGWAFTNGTPRNLYWVNGSGDWNDASHWSLSSGGTPGACIPTPYDNVFFDQNSGFTSLRRTVNLNKDVSFCNDMNWSGVQYYPYLTANSNYRLYVRGSFILSEGMLVYLGNLYFTANSPGKIIQTYGIQTSQNVYFIGKGGGWTFLSDFSCSRFNHEYGGINTNGFSLNVSDRLTSILRSGASLNFGSSTINVRQQLEISGNISAFNAGTSTIISNSPFYLYSNGTTFHNLITNQQSYIHGNNRFNAVTFNHSATLHGSNIFESLTLSPGRTYLFGTGQTQLITALGDFIAEGDGAFPIEVRSTILGQQAFLYKDGDPICLDYLYLTDINASGSAFRYAGANSDDVANNSGLLFEACPGCFAATPGPAPVLDPASVTTVASGAQATLSVMEIPAGFQLIWLNQPQTQELYAGTDITFRPAVQSTTTFYAAFRDLSTGCVSSTLAVTVFACPAPTILSGVFTGETTASLSWRSNELPENNCWTLSLGNAMMSSCTDEANAVFQTSICYQQGNMVFSYPIIGATIDGQVITVEVADLQSGTTLNWFVSEACDGIAAPYDVSGCAGPGDVDTVNDQFTIMTSTVPVTEAFDHPNYTPNGTISVKINNGTCVGTYSISISAINESGPGGSTPPNPANSPRIGVGQGAYVFQQAGIGRYIVTVSQTGICSPAMNPIRDTVTVGSVAGSIPFVLYVSDAEGNLLADTDPFTSTDNSYNFDTLAMLAGTCGRSDRLYVQVLDNTGSTLSTPGLVTASMTALLQSALPTVNISLADDGRFALDVHWVTGLNSLFINGNDNAGNIAELSFSATITDTEPPVLTCTPDTVVFNGQASIALVESNLVSISDNCSSGAAIQTTSTLQSVSCAQLGQLLPVGIMATDGNGNSAACVSQVYVSGLPCGWSSDPGGIGCNSAASYQPGTGLWTLNANQCYSQSPYTSDSLAYAWKTLCGDGSITAAVMSLNDINGWAGITMRETAQAGSKKVQLTTNRHSAVLRREIRSVSNGQAFPDIFPSPQRHWLRLVRSGNRITGYASSDGQSWHYVMDVVLPMNQCIQVGLVAHGINRFQQVTATFAHVSTSGLEVPPLSGGEMPQESVAPYDMAVYPNPTEGMVQLRLPEDIGTEANLEILDMRGQVLMSRRMRAVDAEERLDMRGYPNGMYWIRLSPEGRASVSKRIVLQR